MRSVNLKLYGPIEIDVSKKRAGKIIDREDRKRFLEKIEVADLANKQGCYIFAIRAGQGFCPWYVGKTNKSMKQECMTDPKLRHYGDALADSKKGTPVMFFVAPEGSKKAVPPRICNELEEMLILNALYKNPDLRNIQKTKTPEWGIAGVIRSQKKGRATINEVKFRKMMGL